MRTQGDDLSFLLHVCGRRIPDGGTSWTSQLMPPSNSSLETEVRSTELLDIPLRFPCKDKR